MRTSRSPTWRCGGGGRGCRVRMSARSAWVMRCRRIWPNAAPKPCVASVARAQPDLHRQGGGPGDWAAGWLGGRLRAGADDYVQPVKTSYRGHEVYECPPRTGLAALMILRVIKVWNWGTAGTARRIVSISSPAAQGGISHPQFLFLVTRRRAIRHTSSLGAFSDQIKSLDPAATLAEDWD